MVDTKISAMTTASALSGTEILPIVQSGANRKVTTASLASLVSAVISKQFNLSVGANATYALDSYAEFAYTITGVDGLKTTSGTISVAIQINGVSVTGLSALAVTSTPQNAAGTAANSVAVGDRVTVVYTSNSSATFVEGTLKATRIS